MYGQRLNQLDLRFGKLLRFDRLRASINFDLYNALNSNATLGVNQAYATWLAPQGIIAPRLLKVSLTFDF